MNTGLQNPKGPILQIIKAKRNNPTMTRKNMKPISNVGDVTSKELTPETMQKVAIGDGSGRGSVVTTVTVATQRTLSDAELKAILKASSTPGSANKPMIGKSPSSKRGK